MIPMDSLMCTLCKAPSRSGLCTDCLSFEMKEMKIVISQGSFSRSSGQRLLVPYPEMQEGRVMKEDSGVCDECGEYTEELVSTDGE